MVILDRLHGEFKPRVQNPECALMSLETIAGITDSESGRFGVSQRYTSSVFRRIIIQLSSFYFNLKFSEEFVLEVRNSNKGYGG